MENIGEIYWVLENSARPISSENRSWRLTSAMIYE